MKKLFIFLISAILCIPSSLSAASKNSYWEVLPVESNSNPQFYPDVYEDKIVYSEFNGDKWNLYLHNTTTNEKIQINNAPSDSIFDARAARRGVVWLEIFNGYPQIFYFNHNKKERTKLTDSNTWKYSISVSKDTVVWTDARDRNEENYWRKDIFAINLNNGNEERLTNTPNDKLNPDIYEDKIVWEEYDNKGAGNVNIKLKYLKKESIIDITNGGVVQHGNFYSNSRNQNPKIWEDYITWIDNTQPYNSRVMFYNIESGASKSLTPVDLVHYGHSVDLDNGYIVWVDNTYNFFGDLVLYDVTNESYEWLTNDLAPQTRPRVQGSTVVFQDYNSGNSDIFVATALLVK